MQIGAETDIFKYFKMIQNTKMCTRQIKLRKLGLGLNCALEHKR